MGFGVKDAASAAGIAAKADGVVVGSALVDALRASLVDGKAGPGTVGAVAGLVERTRRGRARRRQDAAGAFEGKPMNWISNVVPPKIRSLLRRDTPENLWVKCPESGQLVFHKDLEANLMVVPGSGYHMAIAPKARLASLFDEGEFEELPTPETLTDPLKFRDVKRYADRLKEHRAKTGSPDAITLAVGRIEGLAATVAVHDFAFQGGTLGIAAGEAIVAGMSEAVARRTPFIIFTASGGARMQEGMFALMQMPRTTVAVQRLRAAQAALYRRAHQSHHRRRHGVLCDARRRADRRTRRRDRIRGRARHRADRSRAPARGLPARRIPRGSRHGRHGGAASRRCARRWRGCARC